MLRFSRHGAYPRSLQQENVHVITARSTLYAFHKTTIRPEYDTHCTKTVLVGCFDRQHADELINVIDHCQRNGYSVNRIIEDDIIDLRKPYIHGASLLPLSIEQVPLPDLEKICLLQYFDLFIVYDIQRFTNTLQLHCYEYKTYETPSSGLIRKYMEDMYH